MVVTKVMIIHCMEYNEDKKQKLSLDFVCFNTTFKGHFGVISWRPCLILKRKSSEPAQVDWNSQQ